MVSPAKVQQKIDIKMKTIKNILKNIGYGIMLIFVAPAAVIHIAYRIWYFKHFILRQNGQSNIEIEKQEK